MQIKIQEHGTGITSLIDSEVFFAALNPRDQNHNNVVEFRGRLYSIIGLVESAGGDIIESGEFTRTAVQGSGSQTIATTKKVKLVFFNASETLNPTTYSDGRSNNVIQNCTLGTLTSTDMLNCISILDLNGTDGALAKTTAFNANDFELLWAMFGAGVNVTVQWHAITGS